jgi:hypothetical protein
MTRLQVAAALLVGLASALLAQPAPPQPMLGEAAPSFRLPDVRTGEMLTLEDLRGRFIVLHFGASW